MHQTRYAPIAAVVALTVASCGGGDGKLSSHNTYKIGGTVTGLSGTGLVLQDSGGDSLQIAADGQFNFPTAVVSGSSYAVSVHSQPTPPPSGRPQYCSVSNGTGTVGNADVTSVSVTCANRPARFVYVVNSGSNTISGYAINSATGELLAMNGSPFPAGSFPRSLTVHPDGHHFYVSNVGDNTISAYTTDASSGVPTPVSGSPFAVIPFTTPAPGNLTPVVIDPSGELAIVGNAAAPLDGNGQPNNLTVCRIDATTGALTPVNGSPFSTGAVAPIELAFDPTGHFVYVWNEFDSAGGTRSTIASFAVDSTAGTLAPVSGSPFVLQAFGTLFFAPDTKHAFMPSPANHAGGIESYVLDGASGAVTSGATIPFWPSTEVVEDPLSRFIYATDRSVIAGYSINSATSVITPIRGTPITVSNSAALDVMTFDPAGRFLYVTAGEGIYAYAIGSSDGALTLVPGSPFAVAHSPDRVVNRLGIDPSGRFAYVQTVPSRSSSSLYAVSIDPVTGALAAVPGSPFAVGIDPEVIAFVN
jgi:6-phosphogluconolactonase